MLGPNEYFYPPQHALGEFARLMNVELTALMQLLLERNNLHQKVYFDPDAIEAEVMEHVRGEHKKRVRLKIAEIRRNLLAATSSWSQSPATAKGRPEIAVPPMLPEVQRFCEGCKQVSVFRPLSIQDAYHDPSKPAIAPELEKAEGIWGRHLILLVFQCRHCKSMPEGFAVRREGWELWLDSRLQDLGNRSPR